MNTITQLGFQYVFLSTFDTYITIRHFWKERQFENSMRSERQQITFDCHNWNFKLPTQSWRPWSCLERSIDFPAINISVQSMVHCHQHFVYLRICQIYTTTITTKMNTFYKYEVEFFKNSLFSLLMSEGKTFLEKEFKFESNIYSGDWTFVHLSVVASQKFFAKKFRSWAYSEEISSYTWVLELIQKKYLAIRGFSSLFRAYSAYSWLYVPLTGHITTRHCFDKIRVSNKYGTEPQHVVFHWHFGSSKLSSLSGFIDLVGKEILLCESV